MKRHKILFIARSYPSNDNPIRGVFIKEHAKAVSLYEEVVVLTSEFDLKVQGLYKINDSIEDGIRVLRVRYSKSRIPKTTYLIYIWGMFRAFKRILGKGFLPDVIHAHVYSAGVPAVLLGKRYGMPVLISEHFSSFPRGMIRGFEKLKAIFALNKANLVTTVSEDLSKHIKIYGIRNRFKVVPNTVNTKIFYPAIKRQSPIPKRLLLVALLNPIKGIPYLLEALAILGKERNDFILDIVGDGPKREEYERLAIELGIEDMVKFYGLKTKEQVAKFMRNADFFVLPSIWENLPCVLIEAMASGLPIVTTKVGGIPEMVDKKIGLLVPPKNVKALSEAIDYMLEHYQDYAKEKIASYARRRFSYEVVGEEFDKIYRNLKGNK